MYTGHSPFRHIQMLVPGQSEGNPRRAMITHDSGLYVLVCRVKADIPNSITKSVACSAERNRKYYHRRSHNAHSISRRIHIPHNHPSITAHRCEAHISLMHDIALDQPLISIQSANTKLQINQIKVQSHLLLTSLFLLLPRKTFLVLLQRNNT